MRPISVDELRELARRSRRTQRAGACAMVAALLAAPLALAYGPWAALVGVATAGALLVVFALVAGQERGAYRALFRALKERNPADRA